MVARSGCQNVARAAVGRGVGGAAVGTRRAEWLSERGAGGSRARRGRGEAAVGTRVVLSRQRL
jgi:hypothetical protein